MSKIRVLSDEVANRIAAGEVVERPASIVKELVENAIDAAATEICVSIEQGGKTHIQISDNGHGMSEDDALLSFERHATSKIKSVQDIFKVDSLGFRGEAIPSIASVSTFNMITRTSDSEIATQIIFEGGTLKKINPLAANIGTTITVSKLFANIPARKKFLRTEQVEYKHILNYLHYQSVVHPEISFIFLSNGKEKLNYRATDSVEKRLQAIFGSEFEPAKMISIDKSTEDARISGYLASEDAVPGLADFRYIFINGRFIKDRIILHAIKKAYEPFRMQAVSFQKSTLPRFILFIEVDPLSIDVNVHPAKAEIRFRDASSVHNLVKNSIIKALTAYQEAVLASARQKVQTPTETAVPTAYENNLLLQAERLGGKTKLAEREQAYQPDFFIKTRLPEIPPPPEKPSLPKLNLKPEEDMINPWQLHNSYVLFQVEDGVMVIDQHAAHERIIYEKLLTNIARSDAPRQRLLFPLVIDVPPYISSVITDLINDNLELFDKVGFGIKTFSANSIVIDEIPQELSIWDDGELFKEILRQLQIEWEASENFRDSLAKSVACKAAVKAGKRMQKKEMFSLINQLFACESPYFCPHGRPLMIKISLHELEKRFKRIM